MEGLFMLLYNAPTSPYGRKVMVTALETGVISKIEVLRTRPSDTDTDLRERNPLGKIPALITDDGTALFDSPVICEYLDSLHDGHKLFPAAGPARWLALRQQAEADGILDAAIARRSENNRREELRSKAWIGHQTAAMHRALAHLEADVDALSGAPTIGQITIGCMLGYLDFRFPDEDWHGLAPNLSDWFAGFSQRPSMQATVPSDQA
jgi:glutathione S-transferase